MNKSYKITMFENGKFCWRIEKTKGIPKKDKSTIFIYWFVVFIFAYWVLAGLISWALSS